MSARPPAPRWLTLDDARQAAEALDRRADEAAAYAQRIAARFGEEHPETQHAQQMADDAYTEAFEAAHTVAFWERCGSPPP